MNKYIILIFSVFISTQAEKMTLFENDNEIDSFYIDSSQNVAEGGRFIDIYDTTGKTSTWIFKNNCQCEEDWSVYLIYNCDLDSIIEGYGYMFGINFGNGTNASSSIDPISIKKAKVAAKYLILKKILKDLKYSYQLALKEFSEKDFVSLNYVTHTIIKYNYLKYIPVSNENSALYNDIGFFLEQGKKYQDAVTILEEVVNAVPTRTVAYINLGDAYFGLQQTDKAREAYLKYIELMKKEGKEAKIPKRVLERVK